jgi:hypothetical protein
MHDVLYHEVRRTPRSALKFESSCPPGLAFGPRLKGENYEPG